MFKIILISTTLLFSLTSQAQSFGATEIIEDTKFGDYLQLMGTNETRIAYMNRNPEKASSKHQYHVVDTENNKVVEMTHNGVIDNDLKGMSMSGIVHGEYLYEVLRFKGKSLKKRTAKIGIVKRKLSDLSQVGSVTYCGLTDIFELYGMVGFMNVHLYEAENGFYVICDNSWRDEAPENDPFVAYLDYDNNMKWKKDLPFLRNDEVKILDVVSDEENGLTLPLHIKVVNEKGSLFKDRDVDQGLAIVRVNAEGELEAFNPELPNNMKFFANKIKYLPSKKEFVGVFYTAGKRESEPKKSISQIEYLKWNSQGELLSNTITELMFKQFETKDFEEVAKKVKFNMNDVVTPEGYISSLNIAGSSYQIIINKDGSFFVGTEEFKAARSYLLTNSGLLMAFSNKGEMVWGKLYSGSGGAAVQLVDKVSGSDQTILKYSFQRGDLHMYRRQYFEKNVGSTKAGKYLEHIVFDFENGEQLSSDLVHKFDDKLKYSREAEDDCSIQRREAIRFFNVTGKKNSFILIQ